MDIMQAITTVGFPIVACVVMGWYIKYITDKHEKEVAKMTDALNNNTLAINTLNERLSKELQKER